MGRITIFSSDGCPHCRRCFAALEQRNIPYTEISITQFPNRRADMLSLSMKLSTPQVFFNTRHVGGADDAIKLLEKWDKQVITRKKYYSAYDRYQAEIANFADPADKRFAVPDCDPVQPEPGPPRVREEEYSVILPDGKTTTVLQVTKTLKKLFIIDDHQSGMTVYKNSFTGEQAVKALTTHYGIPESAAVYFGQELQEQHHILVDVLGRENVKFDNTSTGFFRLQCSQTPDVLNSFRVWTERVDPDPMRLICRLKKMLEKIEIDVMDDDGKVDFRSAQVHKLYSIFEEAVCELQGVKLYKMNDNTKTVRLRGVTQAPTASNPGKVSTLSSLTSLFPDRPLV
jgi:glutaredoxin